MPQNAGGNIETESKVPNQYRLSADSKEDGRIESLNCKVYMSCDNAKKMLDQVKSAKNTLTMNAHNDVKLLNNEMADLLKVEMEKLTADNFDSQNEQYVRSIVVPMRTCADNIEKRVKKFREDIVKTIEFATDKFIPIMVSIKLPIPYEATRNEKGKLESTGSIRINNLDSKSWNKLSWPYKTTELKTTTIHVKGHVISIYPKDKIVNITYEYPVCKKVGDSIVVSKVDKENKLSIKFNDLCIRKDDNQFDAKNSDSSADWSCTESLNSASRGTIKGGAQKHNKIITESSASSNYDICE